MDGKIQDVNTYFPLKKIEKNKRGMLAKNAKISDLALKQAHSKTHRNIFAFDYMNKKTWIINMTIIVMTYLLYVLECCIYLKINFLLNNPAWEINLFWRNVYKNVLDSNYCSKVTNPNTFLNIIKRIGKTTILLYREITDL